eukprot:m.91852 g.91852  ORF g.91852 m.91852 type:complete len:544 (-) comp8619_c0_seq3:105-1736(-)
MAARSMEETAQDTVHAALAEVERVWDLVGLEGEERAERAEEVLRHLAKFVEKIASHETQQYRDLCQSVAEAEAIVAELCVELDLPAEGLPDGLTLLAKDERLAARTEELRAEKERRLETIIELECQLETLNEKLGIAAPDSVGDGACISQARIAELEEQIVQAESTLEMRKNNAQALVEKIWGLWARTGVDPTGSFEQGVAKGVDEMTLSEDTMSRLQSLHNDLEAEQDLLLRQIAQLKDQVAQMCAVLELPVEYSDSSNADLRTKSSQLEEQLAQLQQQRAENIGKFVQAAMAELREEWKSGYFDAAHQQAFSTQVLNQTLSEETLEMIQEETAQVRAYVSENQEIFQLIARREELRGKLEELDLKSSSTDRLNNRGGRLLQEEKLRKMANKELPKLSADLLARLSAFEEAHGSPFLVNGKPYSTVMQRQDKIEQAEKQRLKEDRQRAKKKELQMESHYGSIPRTPKRMRSATSVLTPSASRSKLTTPSRTPLATQNRAFPKFSSSHLVKPTGTSLSEDTLNFSEFSRGVAADARSSILPHT